jgi:hypothetical protein
MKKSLGPKESPEKSLGSRWVLSLVMLASVLSVGTGARAESPTQLSGDTFVRGTRSAAMKVVLNRPATIDLRPRSDAVSISGQGSLYGFVLTAADLSDFERPTVVGLKANICASRGACRSRSVLGIYRGDSSSRVARLPAGQYILYLITENRPASVSLRLGGLTGSTVLEPTADVHAGITPPPTHTDSDHLYANGQVVDFRGRSAMWLTFLEMSGDAWLAGAYGQCIYRGTPPPSPVGFAPGCPGGGGAAIADTVTYPFPYRKSAGGLTFASTGGRWGFGDYYAAAAAARAPGALAFYLDFERI